MNYCTNDRFVPSEVLLIIDLHEKLMVLLISIYPIYPYMTSCILKLWSEQTRQMKRRQLQKLLDEYTDSVFIYLPKP